MHVQRTNKPPTTGLSQWDIAGLLFDTDRITDRSVMVTAASLPEIWPPRRRRV